MAHRLLAVCPSLTEVVERSETGGGSYLLTGTRTGIRQQGIADAFGADIKDFL